MSNRLPILAASARRAHAGAEAHGRAAAAKALEAGASLLEAKVLLPHGKWLPWLRETAIPERNAQRYLALARGGLESAIVADLGMTVAAQMAGYGHRLWPRDGKGRLVEGIDDHEVARACWYCDADSRVRYAAVISLGHNDPRVVATIYPSISKPWLLGLFHDTFSNMETSERTLSIADAEATIASWQKAIADDA